MKVAKLQPKKSHTRIFVSFSGVQAKQARLAEVQKKAGKEVTLCIELDEQGRFQDAYAVRKGEMLRSRFAARQEGKHEPHETIKVRQHASGEVEYIITDAVSIICRETEHSYEYVLVHQVKEASRRKSKRKKAEKVEVAERILFVIGKTAVEYPVQQPKARAAAKRNHVLPESQHGRDPGRVIAWGWGHPKAGELHSPIRSIALREFGAAAYRVTVVLRFLGPGDRSLPQPRAEPMAG
ncbi:hypothetical protein [Ectobacillus ponti]|uniref:Uncharacterized protein n=1 Tax=Ectobacillus ponti TaxID=2961894 RepID=A0AA41X7V9_9BACI|nr:hypothetical protein [Ectobacillus ponti]MCP8970372.1 hypothetical protein [Ectobacillus ponti]